MPLKLFKKGLENRRGSYLPGFESLRVHHFKPLYYLLSSFKITFGVLLGVHNYIINSNIITTYFLPIKKYKYSSNISPTRHFNTFMSTFIAFNVLSLYELSTVTQISLFIGYKICNLVIKQCRVSR
jgi:hypothetical protein